MGDDGNISEWNEGNLKSKRLHDLQEAINYLLSHPMIPNGSGFNYEEALNLIGALYEEGRPKYSTEEQKKLDTAQEIIEYTQGMYPAYHKVTDATKGTVYRFNNENLAIIMSLIRQFNRNVRLYNDKRGLGTRNKTSKGLF